jgi:hypothetical protein
MATDSMMAHRITIRRRCRSGVSAFIQAPRENEKAKVAIDKAIRTRMIGCPSSCSSVPAGVQPRETDQTMPA